MSKIINSPKFTILEFVQQNYLHDVWIFPKTIKQFIYKNICIFIHESCNYEMNNKSDNFQRWKRCLFQNDFHSITIKNSINWIFTKVKSILIHTQTCKTFVHITKYLLCNHNVKMDLVVVRNMRIGKFKRSTPFELMIHQIYNHKHG